MNKITLRCRHCPHAADYPLVDLLLWPWPRHCDEYMRAADEPAWAKAKAGMQQADDALLVAGLPNLVQIVLQAYGRPQP